MTTEPEVQPGPLARSVMYTPELVALALWDWCADADERHAVAIALRRVAQDLER